MAPAVEKLRLSMRGLLSRRFLVDRGALLALVAFLSVGGFALANGGFFPGSWGWASVALLVFCAVALFAGVATRISVLEGVLLACLAALTGWIAASTAWTLDVTHTVGEVERVLVYLAAAATAVVLLRRSSVWALAVGVWAAIAVVSAYGLAKWLLPQHFDIDIAHRGRLSAPVGYWNAFGLLAAMGTLLALGLAARGRAPLRALAAASTVVMLPALYFTFSRGSWIALAVGLGVSLAVDRRRLQLITTMVVIAPWPALTIWAASRSDALTHAHPSIAAAAKDGHGVAVVVVFMAAVAAVAVLILDLIEERIRIPRPLRLGYACVIVLVIALGLGAVFGKYGSPVTVARKVHHSFTSEPSGGSALNKRLFTLSNNGRLTAWRTARQDAAAHRWAGSGAGSFDIYWFEHRRAAFTIHDAHSLYFETLAELGVIGLALLAAVLAVPFVAMFRAYGHPLTAVALGAYAAFVVHAGVDWDWEMPTVVLAALFSGLVVVGAGKADVASRPVARSVRLVAGVVALGLAGFGFLTLLGNATVSSSSKATRAGEYVRAESDARRAMDLLPWSVQPWRRLGEAQAVANHLSAATVSFSKAVRMEPRDWTLWFDLAQVSRGDTRATALRRALALNPLSPEIREWQAAQTR